VRVEFVYEPEQQGTATTLQLQRHTPQEAQVGAQACEHAANVLLTSSARALQRLVLWVRGLQLR
jgi:hypothetical protein